MAEETTGNGPSSSPTRAKIIDQLVAALEPIPFVAAAWLEGADGRRAVDEHSDIDLVLTVDDGYEGQAFAAVENAFTQMATIDHSYVESGGAAGLQHKVYHLAGTATGLLIDVVVQSRSREFIFDPEHPDEIPLPLFDKEGVIRFERLEPRALAEQRTRAWNAARQLFLPEARVMRYVARDRYLEGLAAYQKYVLGPLVDLLRLKYEPRTSGYGLVHISEHLPADVLDRLENLHRVGSVEDLARSLLDARRWYDEIVGGAPNIEAVPPAPSHNS